MKNSSQQTYSLLPLLFFINLITIFGLVLPMDYFHNTVYIRSEDQQSPISIEYCQQEFCCGSNYSTTRSFPASWSYPHEKDVHIMKEQEGHSIIKLCITYLSQPTTFKTIDVAENDELIIHSPTPDNEIIITLLRNGKQPAIEVARLPFKPR